MRISKEEFRKAQETIRAFKKQEQDNKKNRRFKVIQKRGLTNGRLKG